MAELITEWAGKDRLFRLDFGGVLDLEEALSDAIGAIFLRLSSGRFYAKDVYHTIRLALIGGGLGKVEAKKLVESRFDAYPLSDLAALAGEILIALMVGIEDTSKEASGAEPERIKFSTASQICQTFNMSTHDLRAMTYAEFANLVAGFNAASSGRKLEAPTDEEFAEILRKHDPAAYEEMMEANDG